MADIWNDLEDDVSDVITSDGDQVTFTTTAGAATVYVFWQSDSVEDEGLGPRLEVAHGDIPADAKPGDTVTRNATTYTIARFLPDGHGVTTVLLED